MTALLAKKMCCSEDEFEIYEQFVFHNMDQAMEQQQLGKTNPQEQSQLQQITSEKEK